MMMMNHMDGSSHFSSTNSAKDPYHHRHNSSSGRYSPDNHHHHHRGGDVHLPQMSPTFLRNEDDPFGRGRGGGESITPSKLNGMYPKQR